MAKVRGGLLPAPCHFKITSETAMTTIDLLTEVPRLAQSSAAVPRTELCRTRRRSRRSRWARRIANLLLIVTCTLTATAALGNLAGWWQTDTVLTGSMRPSIQPGDVEVLRSEPTSSLRVGQIVAYHPPHDRFIITHRIVAIHHRHGTWITTKGDANNAADPWGSVRILGSTVWTVRGVVPHIGYLSIWVKTPLPHLLLVASIVLLVCAVALDTIWRT